MTEIPQIVEDLYNQLVTIPAPKDWPRYMSGNTLVAHELYSFYNGLRIGFQLAGALREEAFIPFEE